MPFPFSRPGWSRAARFWLALACAAGVPAISRAQLALPGAVAPTPEGTVVKAAPHPAKHRRDVAAPAGAPAAAPVSVVPATALAGKVLMLNGGSSQITFAPRDRGVAVAHLALVGETLGDARKACKVEAPNTPLALKPAGQPDGVERFQVDYPACPLQFDVLDGAVLVDRTQGPCEFKDASCRVDPVGLWGPSSGDLGPDRVKVLEHARARAEAAVRANYKALVSSTKDRAAIAGYARDQAQFSSTREELCRDYAGEGRHGFCAATLTQARAAFLGAKLGDARQAKAERKKQRAAKRAGQS